eukprot:GEMP01015306.1.p1 GENE.GEMP01015306.1~~GEMP01015306.1.p1  ORF type:complete len:631 (+),score=132.82 GEMP01015306.1:217-2109(+)
MDRARYLDSWDRRVVPPCYPLRCTSRSIESLPRCKNTDRWHIPVTSVPTPSPHHYPPMTDATTHHKYPPPMAESPVKSHTTLHLPPQQYRLKPAVLSQFTNSVHAEPRGAQPLTRMVPRGVHPRHYSADDNREVMFVGPPPSGWKQETAGPLGVPSPLARWRVDNNPRSSSLSRLYQGGAAEMYDMHMLHRYKGGETRCDVLSSSMPHRYKGGEVHSEMHSSSIAHRYEGGDMYNDPPTMPQRFKGDPYTTAMVDQYKGGAELYHVPLELSAVQRWKSADQASCVSNEAPNSVVRWKLDNIDEPRALRWKSDIETSFALKSTRKFEGFNEHVKLMPFDFMSDEEDFDGHDEYQFFWPNKLFIGGISPITTTDVLKDHFSRYGKVVDCVVMQKNGRPRGFGFVTFQESDAADRVVMEPQILNGRIVDVKRAIPEQCQSVAHAQAMEAKIFVGGLVQTVTSELLALYFSKFGPVADAVVMRDKATTRSRGFGFVRFGAGEDGQLAMEQVLAKYLDHRLEGKWIEVKKATPPGLSPPPKERPDVFQHGPVSVYVLRKDSEDSQHENRDQWEQCEIRDKWELVAETKDAPWTPYSSLDNVMNRVPSPTRQKPSFSREDFLAIELSTACAHSIFA